jgi:hypothetical protein
MPRAPRYLLGMSKPPINPHNTNKAPYKAFIKAKDSGMVEI